MEDTGVIRRILCLALGALFGRRVRTVSRVLAIVISCRHTLKRHVTGI